MNDEKVSISLNGRDKTILGMSLICLYSAIKRDKDLKKMVSETEMDAFIAKLFPLFDLQPSEYFKSAKFPK
jgi:hypothetical protein